MRTAILLGAETMKKYFKRLLLALINQPLREETTVSIPYEMFKNSKPLAGEALDVLNYTLKKSMKHKPTLPNRL